MAIVRDFLSMALTSKGFGVVVVAKTAARADLPGC
jgi:hypothetical protein